MEARRSTRLILVRHGETEFNRSNRYMGRLDHGLTALGGEQARRLAERLAHVGPIAAIYTSPLARTRETASFLERALARPAQPDAAFLEIDLGPWQGLDRSAVAAEDPERWKIWLTDPSRVRVPGMESIDAVRQRVGAALDRLAARHAGEEFVVVTHFACVVTAILHTLDLPSSAYRRFPVDNASITLVRFGALNKLVRFNDTAHLDDPQGGGVAEQPD